MELRKGLALPCASQESAVDLDSKDNHCPDSKAEGCFVWAAYFRRCGP